jgi:hypothetical protein
MHASRKQHSGRLGTDAMGSRQAPGKQALDAEGDGIMVCRRARKKKGELNTVD